MRIDFKSLQRRDCTFMRCFVTAVAFGWCYILASDYPHPHIAPFRLVCIGCWLSV